MALIRLGRQSKLINELIRPGLPPALPDRNDDFCRNSNLPFDRSVKILSFVEKFKLINRYDRFRIVYQALFKDFPKYGTWRNQGCDVDIFRS